MEGRDLEKYHDDLRSLLSPVVEGKPYITSLVLFGSRARGDFDGLSDFDFHVGFDHDAGGIKEFLSFCDEVEAVLGCRCDFVSTPLSRTNRYLAEEIRKDGVIMYECTAERS